ncbi:sulfite exporter TauE/SafE family protein [bacterium]|nr:sulfite exporter TauE/SafE family protein [bacterium]
MNSLHITGIIAFFTFGFLGSLHCLGMCAPLSIILGIKPNAAPVIRLALYHLGRMISYGFLGFIFSYAGYSLQHFTKIPFLPVLVALPLILYAIRIPLPSLPFLPRLSAALLSSIKSIPLFLRSLSLGLLTPLLPCGFLYSAVLASLQAPTPYKAGLWMASFALGTMPALLLGQSGTVFLSQKIGEKKTQLFFRLLALIGAVFILWMAYFSQHCTTCH